MNTTEDRTYNGWTNYETWAVKLWIDNEQSSQEYWRDIAKTCAARADKLLQVTEGIWTPEQAAKFTLADSLKEAHEDNTPEVSGVYADLINAALSEVNWNEIAENILEGLED